MSKTTNTFVWFDLNTTDKAGARAFYEALFGWKISDRDMGEGHAYTSLALGDKGFGGMGDVQGGAPPHWIGYVDVDDLDARVQRLQRLGASAMLPGMDIPNVGRIAVLADPSGAAFALYQSANEHDAGWEPDRTSMGAIGWAEVASTDVQGSKAFYGEGFGWAGNDMPMPEGSYTMLMSGGTAVGGLYAKPDMMPACAWLFYVNVEDVDATVARAEALGGRHLFGETIPGMVQFALIQDPQGAVIGVAKSLKAA